MTPAEFASRKRRPVRVQVPGATGKQVSPLQVLFIYSSTAFFPVWQHKEDEGQDPYISDGKATEGRLKR